MTHMPQQADLTRTAPARSRISEFFEALVDAHVASRMKAVERELGWRRELIEKAASVHARSEMRAAEAGAPRKPGFWSRLFARIEESRMRAADREIARFIQRNGGRINDRIERDIERRFIRPAGHDWSSRSLSEPRPTMGQPIMGGYARSLP